jgi:hypothetical protein
MTGGVPEGAQAHHVFPQQFRDQFANAGLNIDNPMFGAWWDAGAHSSNLLAYNSAWSGFLATNPALDQILHFWQ